MSVEKIRRLQRAASALELDPTTRGSAMKRVAQRAEAYLEELPDAAVFRAASQDQRWIEELSLSEDPRDLERCLEFLDQNVFRSGLRIGSGRFFGYIPSGGLYHSALADYLAAVTNCYSGVGSAAPGAARLERALVKWLAELMGLPPGADGDLTTGGSLATLSAVVVARDAAGISSREVPAAVVYVTSQSHHTFIKALGIAGMSDCVVREVPTDAAYRMDAAALEESLIADRKRGLNPWLVVATAGTTDCGAVDPLPEIADIAHRQRVWMHVDAAYGGAFALCPAGRARLRGIERADSLVFNPHKGFFLPGGSGVVLIRRGTQLADAYRARGAYMQDDNDQERSACDLSPELTRPFRGLRLWLPLRVFGLAPFRAALEEKLELADYCHRRLSRLPGLVVGPPPDLTVMTFHYQPRRGDANAFNRRLVEAIRADGRILLSSTTLGSRFVLRLAILGYNTHLEDVDLALEVIAELAAELGA